MTNTLWNPDVEVAVHDDELIIKVDHLPEVHTHLFEAEIEDGEMLIRSATLGGGVDHRLHLPLPGGLDIASVQSALHGEALEIHMRVPGL